MVTTKEHLILKKQHMGLTGDIDLRVTSDKSAPRQVEIQIFGK